MHWFPIRAFTLALTALVPLAAQAASDWARLVEPAPRQALVPDQAIAFELSSDLSEAQVNDLFLDIDGSDVTPEVTLDGQIVRYPTGRSCATSRRNG